MTLTQTTTHKIVLPLEFEFTTEGPGEDYEETHEALQCLWCLSESDYKEFAFMVADKAQAMIKEEIKNNHPDWIE